MDRRPINSSARLPPWGVLEEGIEAVKDEVDGDNLDDGFDDLHRDAKDDHLEISTR
tara:strand:+ start:261 stop:428 length:168 start_codon:yes stop_codon:yes gene_type:complete